jgi:hypothetical protein
MVSLDGLAFLEGHLPVTLLDQSSGKHHQYS